MPGGSPASPLAGGPFSSLFTDLSVDLSAGWQMIDMGIRCFRTALKTPEFQKSDMGKVNAVIRKLTQQATTLLSHYTSGPSRNTPSSAHAQEDTPAEPGSFNSPDADDAPEPEP
jgi:hypothetical protein